MQNSGKLTLLSLFFLYGALHIFATLMSLQGGVSLGTAGLGAATMIGCALMHNTYKGEGWARALLLLLTAIGLAAAAAIVLYTRKPIGFVLTGFYVIAFYQLAFSDSVGEFLDGQRGGARL